MKKLYKSPKTFAIVIETEQMIAASGDSSDYIPVRPGGGGTPGAKARFFSSDDYAHDEL